ncbi:MAG: CocE/NonD family hydrolase, partial [Verrucomicrobiae bacterium]|nr:CocE/NonD family hydrolase [Verrucomicrobiae bacterium]
MSSLIQSTRRLRRIFLGVLCVACLAGPAKPFPLRAQSSGVVLNEQVMVPMRDGVKLATFIRRPEGGQKVPAILSRTPYNAAPKIEMPPREQARPGDLALSHAVIAQDVRGRYASEGEFYPFINEGKDGYDTIEWIAQQPWCDGNVIMIGGSYVAYTQLAAAMERPPHLRAIAPVVAPADFNGNMSFHGGALRQELVQGWLIGQAFNSQRVRRGEVPKDQLERWRTEGRFAEWCWHLPLADTGPMVIGGPSYEKAWKDFVGSWTVPRAWDAYSPMVNVEKITVPVLLVAGWYDIFSQGDLDLWAALRYFVMRSDRWVDTDHWPPKDAAPTRYYLRFDTASRKRSLDTQAPPGEAPPSTFNYDPRSPVATLGGNNLTIVNG